MTPTSMWLDDARGHVVDWSTQRWVRATGRRVSLAECPWLDGPIGVPAGIGAEFFDTYAADRGLLAQRDRPSGLLRDFSSLTGPEFDPRAVCVGVR